MPLNGANRGTADPSAYVKLSEDDELSLVRGDPPTVPGEVHDDPYLNRYNEATYAQSELGGRFKQEHLAQQ